MFYAYAVLKIEPSITQAVIWVHRSELSLKEAPGFF